MSKIEIYHPITTLEDNGNKISEYKMLKLVLIVIILKHKGLIMEPYNKAEQRILEIVPIEKLLEYVDNEKNEPIKGETLSEENKNILSRVEYSIAIKKLLVSLGKNVFKVINKKINNINAGESFATISGIDSKYITDEFVKLPQKKIGGLNLFMELFDNIDIELLRKIKDKGVDLKNLDLMNSKVLQLLSIYLCKLSDEDSLILYLLFGIEYSLDRLVKIQAHSEKKIVIMKDAVEIIGFADNVYINGEIIRNIIVNCANYLKYKELTNKLAEHQRQIQIWIRKALDKIKDSIVIIPEPKSNLSHLAQLKPSPSPPPPSPASSPLPSPAQESKQEPTPPSPILPKPASPQPELEPQPSPKPASLELLPLRPKPERPPNQSLIPPRENNDMYHIFLDIFLALGLNELQAQEQALELVRKYDKKDIYKFIYLEHIHKKYLDLDDDFKEFRKKYNITGEYWYDFIKKIGWTQALTYIEKIRETEDCGKIIESLTNLMTNKIKAVNEIMMEKL